MHVGTRNLQIDYDEDSDTLYLHSASESAACSMVFGNVVLDYAKDGTAVGLEFLNATKTIAPLLVVCPKDFCENQEVKREWLKKISKASVSVHTQADFLVISFTLQFEQQELRGSLGVPAAASKQLEKALALNRA